MKIQLLFLCALLFTYSIASAEIKEQFPDLSKALKGGILEHIADNNIIEGYIYEYPADLDFEDIKNQLKAFLG